MDHEFRFLCLCQAAADFFEVNFVELLFVFHFLGSILPKENLVLF